MQHFAIIINSGRLSFLLCTDGSEPIFSKVAPVFTKCKIVWGVVVESCLLYKNENRGKQ